MGKSLYLIRPVSLIKVSLFQRERYAIHRASKIPLTTAGFSGQNPRMTLKCGKN
jgi:hypothetical protein